MRTLRVHPVTGPPGAGKTTALVSLDREHSWLSRFAVREYGLFLAETGHPLGLKMRDTLLHGELLPNDLVQQEFAYYLSQLPDEVESVAVEGYPRDPEQCQDLAEVVASVAGRLAGLIVLDVPDAVVLARVANRRICTRCGLPADLPEGTCPSCGGPTAPRHDDARERLERRLRDFRTISADVRSYFVQRRLLMVVDGLRGPDEVRRRLETLLAPDGHAWIGRPEAEEGR